MLPHSRVELRRWFDSHKVGDCVAERGSEPPRDPLEAVVAPLVIRPSVRRILLLLIKRVPAESTIQSQESEQLT